MSKKITTINGPVIIATGDDDFAMHDMVFIGTNKLMGEVINIEGENATVQVYEETTGLKIGETVIGSGSALSLTLAPGIIGSVFDGVQRPLYELQKQTGDFIEKGYDILPIDINKKWYFEPKVKLNQIIAPNDIIGEVKESETIVNKIMIPYGIKGNIYEIANKGEYTVKDIIAKVKTSTGEIIEISMMQKWPVRKPRPYKKRKTISEPLITGQRVIDSIFPIAKGGTATIPGGFGTGKTILQHQIAKWCNADIIVYIGCGERGNEITQVLEDFPKLIDPRNNRPLMERTVLIANTSNMPVAAREASIYTGITIAEYYRDMGYNVAVMADSTSRWAEALREISGRLEEMPAEEGFPSYLPSRLSEFYGRAGVTESLNGKIGSITIIGAVSPQSSDFSEPVTQNTKRFVNVFWGLDKGLAYSRHYPAINWMISYSEYVNKLETWYLKNVNNNFYKIRQEIIKLLQEENELIEIAKVVGQEVLTDEKKLILEICRAIRIGFLQQSETNNVDVYVPLNKQYKMMEIIVQLYNNTLSLIKKGIPISNIKELGYFDEYMKLKLNIKNNELDKFDEINKKYKNGLKTIDETYVEHI